MKTFFYLYYKLLTFSMQDKVTFIKRCISYVKIDRQIYI